MEDAASRKGDSRLDASTLSLYLAPPIVGGIIGYFTNDIAIRMLFRPYRAKYIGSWRVPFTPGVIPRNQARLAKRVADSITGSLLTPDELQNIARRLLQLDRVQAAILWLLRLTLEQVRADKQDKTSAILANILRDLFGESLPKLLQSLAQREDFLEEALNQIFDQVLLEFQLDEEQAEKLAAWLLDKVIPPHVLRLGLVDFLTDRNIKIIDERFREKTSGTYWVVANLFGLQNSLMRLRSFCLDEPEASDAIIRDLIKSLTISSRLQRILHDFSLQNLPVSTVRQLRKAMREAVRRYLREQGATLLQGLSATINWNGVARIILTRLQKSKVMDESLGLISYELALVLERYLEKDLEAIVAQAIPILQIDQVIIDRVVATPPEEMEAGINELVRTELQAIVNLGGVLGVLIGGLQTIGLLWR
jgi:uncharacterized membrane protein YheB (UPF0754 family)